MSTLLALLFVSTSAFSVEIDRVENATITFKSSASEPALAPLITPYTRPKVLGLMRPPESLPYLILSDDRALYLIRADGAKKMELVYPGRVMDPKTGIKVLDSRGYFGKCIDDSSDVYIVFQTEVVDKKRNKRRVRVTESSIFTAEPDKNSIHEKLTEVKPHTRLPAKEREVQKRVKSKACIAIEGRNRSVLAKDAVSLRNKVEDDIEDEDPEPTPTPSP